MKGLTGKPQILKEVNSSTIEQLVYKRGPLSKPALAKLSSLSLPTVNKLVDALEKSGRLCQAGRTEAGAGRRALLYETNKHSGCMLACYYHLGSWRCRIVDMGNNVVDKAVYPLDLTSRENALASTFEAVDSLSERAPSPVKAIGFGMPGVVSPDGRLQGIPQIAAWEGFKLQEEVKKRYLARVCVENNVKLSAFGYYHSRFLDKLDNMAYIYVGNGIGTAFIINGQLYRGAANFSGEIGFMTCVEDHPPLERAVSAARKRPPPAASDVQGLFSRGGLMEARLGRYVDFARGDFHNKDDPRQREGFTAFLSMIVTNHVAALNPELVVLSGQAFCAAIMEDIKRRVARHIPPAVMPRLSRDSAGDSGLAGLILVCRDSLTTGIQLVRSRGVPQNSAA